MIIETTIRDVQQSERGGKTWYTAKIDPTPVSINGTMKTVQEVTSQQHELGEQMRRYRDSGERVAAEVVYKERQGRDRIFENWYFEGARAIGPGSGPPPAAPRNANGYDQPKPAKDDQAWRIALSVGAKLALETLPLLPPEERRDPEAQWQIALFWASRIYNTPAPAEPTPPAATVASPAGYGDPGPIEPAIDDIAPW